MPCSLEVKFSSGGNVKPMLLAEESAQGTKLKTVWLLMELGSIMLKISGVEATILSPRLINTVPGTTTSGVSINTDNLA